MKNLPSLKVILASVLGLLASISTGHAIVVAASGTIANPTDSDGGLDLINSTYAALFIDTLGDGLELSPGTFTTDELIGDDFLVAFGVSETGFGGPQIVFADTPVDLDLAPDAGDQYYVAWFIGQTGTTPTTITLAEGDPFGFDRSADWILPSLGNTGPTTSAASPFGFATVIPEPSTSLLSALAVFGLIARRRR
ncbi:MAG: PEP-CTERM sorting domain-containing protein [Verrucomicrobiota bacterium]